MLSGLPELKVCTAYKLDGKIIDTLPADVAAYARVEPVYETLPGWQEDLKKVRASIDIPVALQNYMKFIEDGTGAKIHLISTGAGREAVIDIQRAF